MSAPPVKPAEPAPASPEPSDHGDRRLLEAESAPRDPATATSAPPDPSGSGPAAPETADANHWLYRLNAEQWLTAADNELRSATEALSAKQQRAGITHARRAAGMALNARLRLVADDSYGRSYMEHLQALHKDPAVSQELREAAGRLLAAPLTQQLVTLGPRGDTRPAEFATRIIEYVRHFIAHRPPPAVH